MLYSPSSHASIFSPMLLHFLFKGIFFLFDEPLLLSL